VWLVVLKGCIEGPPLPAAVVFRRLGSLLYDRNLESHL
jgi:hypothetical protein